LPALISLPWTVGALALFVIKHLVADFLLQPGWMSRGKKSDKETGFCPRRPTLWCTRRPRGIFRLLAPSFIWLAAVELLVHFAIDRSKVVVNRAYSLDIHKQGFWYLFGVDQTLHQLTNIAFALVIAAAHSSA
jgi:hypothetical protein